ncbi:uncharacterized protein apof [Brienomyrus brachyistius]|uniref:uncharacterized protein apof n=1 Tax=Brienomyrus brachyistius TaxID=42636 RepID=UPI0020B1F69C|nr:uncharacterized protein apof [Brienomyrus brachyistius]
MFEWEGAHRNTVKQPGVHRHQTQDICLRILQPHHPGDCDGMASPILKWLMVIQLLLLECVHSQPAAPPGLKVLRYQNMTLEDDRKPEQLLTTSGPPLQAGLPSENTAGPPGPDGDSGIEEESPDGTLHLARSIMAMLREKMRPVSLEGSVSCEELLATASPDSSASALFPRELLGLSLVPVLVAAGCSREAQVLVLQLFELLGQEDTEELLLDLEELLERNRRLQATSSPSRAWRESHLQAVMFNIQQLAKTEEEWGQNVGNRVAGGDDECQGWIRVNGTQLLGQAAEEEGGMAAAVRACEILGYKCAGVSPGVTLGLYRAVLRRQSRVVPSADSECWIRECGLPRTGRVTRSTEQHCVDKREERVYSVVEWIPAVSTLYGLGTAVYYASVNCSTTAKERALLSAVDLGTDALMAVTGGTVGVAGYALGAGVKTGVKAGIKYLLKNMNSEEDIIMNQNIWSTTFTIE